MPTAAPIHVATAYSYATTEDLDAVFADNSIGYVYSRYGNPTVRAFEHAIAAVEKTEEAIAFGSGMAAIHAAIVATARSGSRVLASQDLYGATHALLRSMVTQNGIETTFVDIQDLDLVRRLAEEIKPAAIIAETISNPLIRVTDIPAITSIATDVGAISIIDNTFASPVIVQPATLGADIVVHSTTKFIGGHGDTTGGVIATSGPFASILREQAKLLGAIAGPFDAWLALRGLRTMHLRVRQQSENARTIAEWLHADPRIDRVNYPCLTEGQTPQVFADKGRGGLLSFEIGSASRDGVFAFQDALKLCIPATTLGDVYSLVLYPAMSSHRALTPEERNAIGIRDNLVRFSAGIEDVEDIRNDIDQALYAAHS
jgi:cystathionine gamma-synthase/methionine-gamma-lyase